MTTHAPRSAWTLARILLASTALSFSAHAATVTGFRIGGLPATTPAGSAAAFTVTAVDSSGSAVTTYRGTVHFTINFPATVLPVDYTFTAGDSGVHQFSMVPKETGKQILDVVDTVSTTLLGEATTICTPGPATQYTISNLTNGTSLNAGVPATFDITAYDDYYNVATGYAGTAVITSSDPAALLPPKPIFSQGAVRGVSITFGTGGGQSVTATDTIRATMTDTAWATVDAAPLSTITAPAAVTAGTSATASVASQTGVTYSWGISNGTISAGQGTNQITFVAGTTGTVGLDCTVVRTAGGATSKGTKSVSIVAPPQTPVVTAASPVTAGATGLTASLPARAGMTYSWTLSAGTITGAGGSAGTTAGGTNTLTYTAPATGPFTVSAVEINAAGTSSNPGSAQVQVAPAPVAPSISAPANVTTGDGGVIASVTARAGMTYSWTIAGGTITSSGGASGVTSGTTNTITFSAGAVGTLTLTCTETNAAGASGPAGSNTVNVAAVPSSPAITAASQVPASSTGNVAQVTARAGMTYSWTLSAGAITSAGGAAGVAGGGLNKITYTAPSTVQTLTLTCVEVNAAGASSAAGRATVSVVAASTPQTPTISTAAVVTAGATGRVASVTARSGMTYAWTLSNGTITSAGGTAGVTSGTTNQITYTAGSVGSISLTCAESNGTTSSSPGTASVSVVAPPATPTIVAASPVPGGATGLSASVTAHTGMTYAWTIANGSITSANGTAGVTSGSTNSISYTAGPSGSVSLGCSEINAAGTASAPASATVAISGGNGGTGHLYVVAHQDDDLLFANPAIEQSIKLGVPTRTVFLVAAGGPDTVSWQAREAGVFNAENAMTGGNVDPTVSGSTYWTCGSRTFAGKSVRVCTSNLMSTVSVAFLRLPDGSLSSLWSPTNGAPFYVTPAATLTAYDGSATYTKTDLIATLRAMLDDFKPAAIGTSDSSFAYGDDHQDHITSALFTLEAERGWNQPHRLRLFRGYNIAGNYFTIPSPEIVNLSDAEYAEKRRVMVAYGGDFAIGSDYDNWSHRHYAVQRTFGGTGALANGSQCVDTAGGSSASGTGIVLAACSGAATQNWKLGTDGLITGAAGRCLTLAADLATVTLADCTTQGSQRWTAFSNGQIRGANGTCLTVGADGITVGADLCGADSSTVKYKPLASQTFIQQFSALTTRSSGTDFSSTAGGNAELIGDIDGDGFADACLRLSTGLYCALNDRTGKFGAYTLWSSAFSDANGWLSSSTGDTLQLADVNGDGRADVCGRSTQGVVCALAQAGGFGPASLWTSAFSDAAGYGSAATYFRSFHLADVDGDGFADVCARSASGIQCAINTTKGGFGAASSFLSTEFTDAKGWLQEMYGATVQLADVNGDHKADVCGRSASGLVCAISTGTSFINAHPWSLRTDFSDGDGWNTARARWGSISLADVNGDGLADACGRGPSGLVCAISHGNGFDAAGAAGQRAFTDAQGFNVDAYGASLRLGDINGDGKADACGRTASGLACSVAP